MAPLRSAPRACMSAHRDAAGVVVDWLADSAAPRRTSTHIDGDNLLTCPPVEDHPSWRSQHEPRPRLKRFSYEVRGRDVLFHSAAFATVQWTNLWFRPLRCSSAITSADRSPTCSSPAYVMCRSVPDHAAGSLPYTRTRRTTNSSPGTRTST